MSAWFGARVPLESHRSTEDLEAAHLIVICAPPEAFPTPLPYAFEIQSENVLTIGIRNLHGPFHNNDDTVGSRILKIPHKFQHQAPLETPNLIMIELKAQSPDLRAMHERPLGNQVLNTVVTGKVWNCAFHGDFTERRAILPLGAMPSSMDARVN